MKTTCGKKRRDVFGGFAKQEEGKSGVGTGDDLKEEEESDEKKVEEATFWTLWDTLPSLVWRESSVVRGLRVVFEDLRPAAVARPRRSLREDSDITFLSIITLVSRISCSIGIKTRLNFLIGVFCTSSDCK